MPASRERLIELLDAEEPDYPLAASEAGLDTFDVLTGMVQEADPWVAALGASLAARLAADPAVAAEVLPVLELAAGHAASGVRAAAALGASRVGSAALGVTNKCLADPDPGVRAIAFRGLAVPLEPKTETMVQALAADPEPVVREKATALAARIPDPTLPGELLAQAISYALARLNELSADVLGSVEELAAALDRPGFPDPGGTVAGLLAEARAAFDVAATRLALNDHKAAAVQLGLALKAIADGCAAIGGSLIQLLNARIDWGAGGAATGLARQLGFAPGGPQLKIEGNALFHKLIAPGQTLMGPPLTLRFERAELTSRLAMGGAGPALAVSLEIEGLEGGLGSGPLASLLGGAAGSFASDVIIGVDSEQGLSLGASASPRLVVPARPKAGPIDVREIVLEIPSGPLGMIEIGSTIATKLGAVIGVTVDGAGLRLQINPGAGAPVSVWLKPPHGMGLVVDAGLVRGGGYLGERPGGFGGALQLRMGPVKVKAVGLLTLEPSFALVLVMSVEFRPPIDLTFGFTLNAVGGVIGIEHRLDAEALRAGISGGALDHIMFPPDPVAAAPAILTTLEHVFPFEAGSIVIGPMLEIGWGRPISFVTGQLGVLLSLPDPGVVIIGRIRVGLPAPELPIIDLKATIYGEVTADQLAMVANLEGSRIAGYTVGGDMGLVMRWGGQDEFAISAGGFNPRFDAPADLAGLRRLSMDLSPPVVLTLRAEAYFALTPNSLQLGARVEAGGDLGVADISGHFGFDAIVLFSPHFAFVADAQAAVAVHALGQTVAGVHVQLHLEGPSPWRAEGHAEVEVLWTSVPVDVGPLTWGDATNPPPAPADPRQLVHAALHRNPGAWQALSPPDADRVVRLKPAPPSQTDATIHPMGLLDVRQHAVPLEKVITHVGPNPVPDGMRRVFLDVPQIDGMKAGALSEVTDLFSPGAFLELTEDEKLSRSSFEPMLAGARVRPPGESADWQGSRQADLKYETFVCDDDNLLTIKTTSLVTIVSRSAIRAGLAAGAAGRTELRAAGRYSRATDPVRLAHPSEVEVVSKITAIAVEPGLSAPYSLAAERALPADAQLARLGVA
jgi:hypothetical protein